MDGRRQRRWNELPWVRDSLDDPPIPPGGGRMRRRRRAGGTSGPRRLVLALLVLGLLGGVATAGLLAAGGFAARSAYEEFRQSCDIETATAKPLGQTSYVYAADGTFLGPIRAEIYRQPVPAEQISPWLEKATIAIEDRRFYAHDGLDFQGIARAAVENLQAGEIVEGGSTITQQLIKTMYLTPDRTWDRKQVEACLALQLEERWDKQQILTTYLNRVYFGHRAWGAEAAAQTYFSVKASQLGPAQAALIAGLPQAPSLYDPWANPERALSRRNQVLRAMRDAGFLPQAAYEKAVALPLNLRRGNIFERRRFPYFFDYVRRQLVDTYGERAIRRGGLRVHTTILPRHQIKAEQSMRAVLGGRGDPASAIVSIDPATGAIRALTSVVPGAQPDFNLAFQGRRQAGSSFKPFVLVEALERGIHPWQTTYPSRRFSYVPGPYQEPWEPKTYSGSEYGTSTIAQATLRSDNLVYARMTLDLGPGAVADTARKMGVTTPLQAVPSIGLGANSVSPLEMASAYATLASGGVYREPYAIQRVELPDGEVDESWSQTAQRRVLSKGVADHATQILQLNVQRGTGTRAQIGRPAAGKTGTTDDHTDAWFVGYTPQLATAVWVGYPNKTAQMTNVRGIRVTGGSFPAMMWGRYMSAVHEGEPVKRFGTPAPIDWRPWTGHRWQRASSGGADDGAG